MKKILGLVAFVLVLAALVLWWFRDSGDLAPLTKPATDARSQEDQPATARRSQEVLQPSELSASSTTLAADFEAASELKTSILVRCLNQTTNEPVGGLNVCLWLPGDRPPSGTGNIIVTGAEMRRFPRRYQADDRGEVKIIAPGEKFSVGAWSEDFIGHQDLYYLPTDGVVTIKVSPRRFVTAKVVDARGEPQYSAVISLVHKTKTPGGALDMVLHHEFMSAEDGIVRMPLRALDEFAAGCKVAFLRLSGLHSPHVEAEFDAINLPIEPVLLQMPASGSVNVSVISSGGEEPGEDEIWFSLADATARGNQIHQTHYLPVGNGHLEFMSVALGRRFVLRVEPKSDSHHAKRNIEFDGPKHPGETAHLTVDLRDGPWRSSMTGRLLDQNNEPLRHQRGIYMEAQASPGGGLLSQIDTDAEGRFLLRLEASSADWQEVEIKLSLTVTDLGPVSVVSQAKRGERSEFDFGDLSLSPLPLLSRGRVIDDRGLPVAGARVRSTAPEVLQAVPGTTLIGMTATNTAGEFALHGDATNDLIGLMIEAKGFMTLRTEVVRGRSDQIIRLERASWLKAQLVADDPTYLAGLAVELVAGDDPERPLDRLKVAANGLVNGPTRPGRVIIRVMNPSFTEALWQSEVITLLAGQTTDLGEIRIEPPRLRVQLRLEYPTLGAVDLGSKNYRFEGQGMIHLVDGGGQSMKKLSRLRLFQDEIVLYLDALPARLRISMAGMLTETIDVEQRELTHQFQPGVEVTMIVAGLPPLPEGIEFGINLLPEAVDGLVMSSVMTMFSKEQDRGNWTLSSAGRMTIEAYLMTSGAAGLPRLTKVSDLVTPRTLMVVVHGEDQVFRVQVDTKTLDERLRELAK